MALMPAEIIPKFEKMIYLPMIIKVLERDRGTIEISSFKLKGPYIQIVESALSLARVELKDLNIDARNKKLQLIRKKKDDTFTEYAFEDIRRYLNIRLRNRTEELISIYFEKGMLKNG